MAEMIVALLAMVVIMVGIVTLGEVGYHQVGSMLKALDDASQNAISEQSDSGQYQLIKDWDAGRDNLNYTADDRSVNWDRSDFYEASRRGLRRPSCQVDYPDYSLGIPAFDQHNLTTQIPDSAVTGGWSTPGIDTRDLTVGGIERGSERVDFGNALQRLVYGADKISIRNEVYWPRLSKLGQAP